MKNLLPTIFFIAFSNIALAQWSGTLLTGYTYRTGWVGIGPGVPTNNLNSEPLLLVNDVSGTGAKAVFGANSLKLNTNANDAGVECQSAGTGFLNLVGGLSGSSNYNSLGLFCSAAFGSSLWLLHSGTNVDVPFIIHNNATTLTILSTGFVGINNTTPAFQMDVTGFINSGTQNNNYKIMGATVLQLASPILDESTFVGVGAGNNSFGSNLHNTFVGYNSGHAQTTGNENTFLGTESGILNTMGEDNVFAGFQAGNTNSTGNHNTLVGDLAGGANTTGSNNTIIGGHANMAASNLMNAAAIGYFALVCADNMMVFGNGQVTRWGFAVCPANGHAIQVGYNATNGNGAFLSSGGTWVTTSDRALKENFQDVDQKAILKLIDDLEITRWNYKGESPNFQHIGPMAQDFFRLFSVGYDDKSISTIDPAGVALVGIKGLHSELIAQQDELEKKQNDIDKLTNQLETVKNQIAELKEILSRNGILVPQQKDISDAGSLGLSWLAQNNPNPFTQNSSISYFVPEKTISSYIIISDLQGKQIRKYDITQKGNGVLLIKGGELYAGTFLYTLIADEKEIDTRKMILTN